MAEMPNGKSRSVPNPLGDPHGKLVRQRGAGQSAIAAPTPLAAGSFPSAYGRLALLNRAARPNPYVTIGSRTYKRVDNGRADVLVHVDDPAISPTVRADRRRAVTRALFMADHPLGSAAYAIATLANASPQARNGALIGGSAADTALLGAAPRPRFAPLAPTARRPVLAPPLVKQSAVRHGRPTPLGQATGLVATLTASTLGSGTKANRRVTPPGWQGDGTKYNEARGHLQAKQLGGSGRSPLDLVTLTQNPTNSSLMQRFENATGRRVKAGEIIQYTAMPLYNAGVLAPARILLAALGSREAPIGRIIGNPAGRKRDH